MVCGGGSFGLGGIYLYRDRDGHACLVGEETVSCISLDGVIFPFT